MLLALTATASLAFATPQSDSKNVPCGESATLTATPETGYHFVEWQKGGVQVSTSASYQVTNVQEAAEYTAIFAIDTYTITYNKGANGSGADIANDTKTYNVALTLSSSTYSRVGYTQTGWATADGGAKAYDLGGSYTANAAANLYPFWVADVYTISYLAGTGATGSVASTSKTYGVNATLSSNTFNRTGYHQTGWATEDGGAKAYDLGATNYAVEGNSNLYPSWEVNTYTISYAAGTGATGTVASTSKTHFVDATLSSNTFTRAGYTQDGWATEDGGAKAYDLGATDYDVEGNATLYPHWVINHYTITYDGGAYGSGSVASTNKTHGVNTNVSNNVFTRDCYTQVGWSYADGGAEAFGLGAVYSVDASTTLYPVWQQNTFSVTFKNYNDAELKKDNAVACGSIPVKPTSDPVHEVVAGHTYTFTGWNDGTTTYPKAVDLPAVSADVVYTAVFTDETLSYTVTVAASGSGTVSINGSGTSKTDAYGTAIQLVATPAACYQFVRWTLGGAEVSTSATFDTTITGNNNYTAVFEQITYTIKATSEDSSKGTVTVTLP